MDKNRRGCPCLLFQYCRRDILLACGEWGKKRMIILYVHCACHTPSCPFTFIFNQSINQSEFMKVLNLKSLMPDRSSVLRYFARTSSERILGKEPLLFMDGSLSKKSSFLCLCAFYFAACFRKDFAGYTADPGILHVEFYPCSSSRSHRIRVFVTESIVIAFV